MRTTLDLPDELYRALKRRAVERGITLKRLVAELLAEALTRKGRSERGRSDVPPRAPFTQKAPLLSKDEQREIEAGEMERYARSFGH